MKNPALAAGFGRSAYARILSRASTRSPRKAGFFRQGVRAQNRDHACMMRSNAAAVNQRSNRANRDPAMSVRARTCDRKKPRHVKARQKGEKKKAGLVKARQKGEKKKAGLVKARQKGEKKKAGLVRARLEWWPRGADTITFQEG
jgi:hypothetical protein